MPEKCAKSFSDRIRISETITHQRTNYRWEFLFLAANADATASRMGIDCSMAAQVQCSRIGVHSSSKSFSRKVRAMREQSMDLQENPDLHKPMDEIVAEEQRKA